MGFQYQTADYVAGTVLVIERIQSQNYQAGTVGWAIYANGNAEFNNLVARGSLLVGNATAQHILIALDPVFPFLPTINFYTGTGIEASPGQIQSSSSGSVQHALILNAPAAVGALGGSQIFMATEPGIPGRMTLTASEIDFNGDTIITAASILQDQVWQSLTRVNSWVDFAGSRARFFKDAAGVVHVNGVIASGTAVLIGTLPAGYRPSQVHEFGLVSAAAHNVLCAVQIDTTGAITIVSNLVSAQARLALDFAFPTLS